MSIQGKLDKIPSTDIQRATSSLVELHNMGECKTDEEVKQRIDDYFSFCVSSSIRPGIESLCLALHITRMTLFRWAKGIGCSPERKQMAEAAKQTISAFIEQMSLAGKVPPVTAIFLMKNWCGYRDGEPLEDNREPEEQQKRITREELGLPPTNPELFNTIEPPSWD